MARIRSIKPEFWKHEQIGRMSFGARLTFIGLMCFADDQGRGRADAGYLWGELHCYMPDRYRKRLPAILKELESLADDKGKLVIFYEIAGARYYWLPGFNRQQRIDKPQKPKYPPPPDSKNDRGTVKEGSETDRIKDRKGGEGSDPEPPRKLTPREQRIKTLEEKEAGK